MSSFPKKYVLIVAILVSIGIVAIFSITGIIPNFFSGGNLGNTNSGESIQYKMNLPNQTLMFNTFSSYGLSTHSGRQIHAEYVSDTSSLVGKSIDSITLNLKRGGSPSGTVEVGVFNTDRSIKQLFGKINTNAISTSYSDYSFSLPLPQIYQIQSGDRIGIKFTGGDNANHIAIMTDQTNFFDGANSYHTYYTDSWKKSTSKDLYMILKSSVYDTGLTVSASLTEGTNSTTQSVTLISNKPSTIFYTNDGSTPTTSSAVYSSPITIFSTTTLKFFARDSLENTSPTMVQIYTVFPSSYDVSQLYLTTSGGREWFSKWDNRHLRTLNNGNRDPDDSLFILTGSSDSKLVIDGDGIVTMSGKQPRMYVNDQAGSATCWRSIY
ncbi:MAG: putative xylanase/chitin deacetylase [Nitrosarchaeum sp.]|nr:putative xylanase/chitin deacetylase [Nitrosarchaeum sp.]